MPKKQAGVDTIKINNILEQKIADSLAFKALIDKYGITRLRRIYVLILQESQKTIQQETSKELVKTE